MHPPSSRTADGWPPLPHVLLLAADCSVCRGHSHDIVFCEDASNIISHCYYGLCDISASSSAIPYELYREIMHEIGPCELEDTDVVIHLANKETICPIGIVRDMEVLRGKIKYPVDFLVLNSAASKTCPIIFGRPFLNTCGAILIVRRKKF